MANQFYSHGKLLITGEYLVLDGATALAIPTKFGQDLIVEENQTSVISWTSYDADGTIWFNDIFTIDEIRNYNHHQASVRHTLMAILRAAFELSSIPLSYGFKITTHLSFPRFWGLGTSSTLINNIAQWMQIDPFILLQKSFGGSGYDIACANSTMPILYRLEENKPYIKPIDFKPPAPQNLYFVYLNKKQSSKAAIASYKKINTVKLQSVIERINLLTDRISSSTSSADFADALEQHEKLISGLLQVSTIKHALFADFSGVIKSLGAWGGDFVLAIAPDDPTGYFEKRGFKTVIKYNDMVL